MNPENPVNCCDEIISKVKQLSGEESEYSKELIYDLIDKAFENNILLEEKSKNKKNNRKKYFTSYDFAGENIS